jgi:hypothetical protein
VVRATPQEVEAFGARRGDEVELLRPRMTLRVGSSYSDYSDGPDPQVIPNYMSLRPGHNLYDAGGRVVAVVQEINLTQDRLEVTSLGDVVRNYVNGFVSCDIRAVGVR